ncbi:MAG: hypothetical protein GY699_22100 [Desulfobacteraceae bacterium]|nr:hypothetical protein [Desulfobacteraceae bacterium]
MDNFLDSIWESIETFLTGIVTFMDKIFSPLEILGPGFVIFIFALIVVGITRLIGRFYETKRFVILKKEFEHWQSIRVEAMKHPDSEKGKALAKNIDQGELNKAYYDYFFEGLLKNFITNVLPLLLMAAYITTIYSPQTLLKRFGKEWVFSFTFGSNYQVNASSLLWYVVCVLFSFIGFAIIKYLFKKQNESKLSA